MNINPGQTQMHYAEEFNYWKTSKHVPGYWLDKASDFLCDHGAEVRVTAKGTDNVGSAAYLMEFSFGTDSFRVVWPVLPSKNGDTKAAERQAATMLFHDIKSRALRLAIYGARAAYFDFLRLPDGRTMAELASSDIADAVKLLPAPS